jgi:protein AbiQ
MKLYSISDNYISYLREEFPRVFSNKEDVRIHTRKYLGVVISMNNYNYYIPLSSPKIEHDYIDIDGKKVIRKSSLIVIRIVSDEPKGKELKGTLQIGTMIPVPYSELIEYDIDSEADFNYKNLVWKEMQFIRKNEKLIIKNAKLLYNKKSAGSEEKIVKNCLDFKAVEKRCDSWEEQKR